MIVFCRTPLDKQAKLYHELLVTTLFCIITLCIPKVKIPYSLPYQNTKFSRNSTNPFKAIRPLVFLRASERLENLCLLKTKVSAVTGTHFLNKHYPSNLSTNSVSKLTQIYQQKPLKNTTTQICVKSFC